MKSFKIYLKEMGIGPYIGGCNSTATYQVYGSCSDLKPRKKRKKFKEWISERINKKK